MLLFPLSHLILREDARERGFRGSERLLDLLRLTQQWSSDSIQVCRKMGGGSRRVTWKFPGPTGWRKQHSNREPDSASKQDDGKNALIVL